MEKYNSCIQLNTLEQAQIRQPDADFFRVCFKTLKRIETCIFAGKKKKEKKEIKNTRYEV